MTDRDDRPRPERPTAKPSSSTTWRLEHASRLLADLGDRLRSVDDRVRTIELEGREHTTELRADLRALRDLLDRVHRESAEVQTKLVSHERRIVDLELEIAKLEGEKRSKALAATGGGIAGGGILYALVEAIKKLL